MIADLVTAYKKISQGTKKGLLSESEKAKLVNRLEKKEDIKSYNEYKYVHDFVVTVPLRYMLAENIAEAAFWKLYNLLKNVDRVERDNRLRKFAPLIVTKSEYNRMKKADFKEKISYTISVESFIIHAIAYFMEQYKQGKKTPFDQYFEEAKKKPVHNPRILESKPFKRQREEPIENSPFPEGAISVDQIVAAIRKRNKYDEEQNLKLPVKQIEKPQRPKIETMFEVLEDVRGFYYSQETGSDDTFFELEGDYPEVYGAIRDYVASIKPLSFINNVLKADIVTDRARVPYQLLYNHRILNFREIVDTFVSTEGMLAIFQENNFLKPCADEEGSYKKTEYHYFENYRAERLLDTYRESVEEWMDTIKRRYREMYAFHVFLALTGEFCDVNELEILLSPIDEDMIEALNHALLLWEDIAYANDRDAKDMETIKQKIMTMLPPILISDLRPTEESIDAAKANMTFQTFQGNAMGFINQYLLPKEEAT